MFILNFIIPINIYKIKGQSMRPVLDSGDFVVVNKLSYLFHKPRIGDIAAIKDPRDGRVLIKRVAKISGEKYLVEGDNKAESTDSRHFGLVERKSIIGKVIWSSRF